MSSELEVVVYVVAIVLLLLAAWSTSNGRRPAQELGWIAIAVALLVPLWAAIKAT